MRCLVRHVSFESICAALDSQITDFVASEIHHDECLHGERGRKTNMCLLHVQNETQSHPSKLIPKQAKTLKMTHCALSQNIDHHLHIAVISTLAVQVEHIAAVAVNDDLFEFWIAVSFVARTLYNAFS